MVTITSFTETHLPRTPSLRTITSAAAAKTETVELTLPAHSAEFSHVFIGVQIFDIGGAQIVDSAGTFTVTVQLVNTKQYEVPASNVIDATAPTTVNLAGNVHKIRIVPASLSDTVTYQVIMTASRD